MPTLPRPFRLVLAVGVLGAASGCAPNLGNGPRAHLSAEAPDLDLARLERSVHDGVNARRRAEGARTLAWNDSLATVARRHSADMAQRGFFDHQTPEGLSPTDRARRVGFRCELVEGRTVWRGVAENLFYTQRFASGRTVAYADGRRVTTYDWKSLGDLSNESVVQWMNSPGHRSNLLNARSRRAGVGVALGRDFRVYFTQVFC